MEFLYEKIYSNQYFALILFVTIAILLILFVVVLFAAIRDTKKKQLDGLEKLEQETKDRVLSDDTIFGVEKAFKEETPKEPLEFFKNEDDISKTRDMVLSTPTRDNSMNSLLNEFEDEKKAVPLTSEPVFKEPPMSQDIPVTAPTPEPVHEDIVVPNVVVPIPEVSRVVPPQSSVEPITNIPSEPIVEPVPFKVEEIPKVKDTSYIAENIANSVPKVEEEKVIDDSDDEFELPAIKSDNINLEKEVSPSSISNSGIDFGKTGILNFNNIESESYEIK